MGSWAGADPDAMGRLAVALERAADELATRHRVMARLLAEAGAAAPGLGALSDVEAWLRRWSRDVRRRAVIAGADGRAWRHPSTWDHLRAVARAGLRGVVDGGRSVATGAGVAAHLVAETATEPERLATAARRGGAHGVADLVAHDVAERAQLVRSAADQWVRSANPLLPVASMAVRTVRDGGWAAAEDGAYDSGTAVPGAALTVAGAVVGVPLAEASGVEVGTAEAAGAEAAPAFSRLGPLVERLSDASNLSLLAAPADAAVSPATAARLLPLSVPVGDPSGARVALDPENGRFVVLPRPGDGRPAVHRRWGELTGAQHRALVDAGIVDRHGRIARGV